MSTSTVKWIDRSISVLKPTELGKWPTYPFVYKPGHIFELPDVDRDQQSALGRNFHAYPSDRRFAMPFPTLTPALWGVPR